MGRGRDPVHGHYTRVTAGNSMCNYCEEIVKWSTLKKAWAHFSGNKRGDEWQGGCSSASEDIRSDARRRVEQYGETAIKRSAKAGQKQKNSSTGDLKGTTKRKSAKKSVADASINDQDDDKEGNQMEQPVQEGSRMKRALSGLQDASVSEKSTPETKKSKINSLKSRNLSKDDFDAADELLSSSNKNTTVVGEKAVLTDDGNDSDATEPPSPSQLPAKQKKVRPDSANASVQAVSGSDKSPATTRLKRRQPQNRRGKSSIKEPSEASAKSEPPPAPPRRKKSGNKDSDGPMEHDNSIERAKSSTNEQSNSIANSKPSPPRSKRKRAAKEDLNSPIKDGTSSGRTRLSAKVPPEPSARSNPSAHRSKCKKSGNENPDVAMEGEVLSATDALTPTRSKRKHTKSDAKPDDKTNNKRVKRGSKVKKASSWKGVLCSTGLVEGQRVLLNGVADIQNTTVKDDMDKRVTHMVINAVRPEDKPTRTMKLCKAIAAGVDLVCFKWVEDSAGATGSWKEINDYIHPWTKKGAEPLFRNMRFYFGNLGDKIEDKDEYLSIVKFGGGEVLTMKPVAHARSSASSKLVLVEVGTNKRSSRSGRNASLSSLAGTIPDTEVVDPSWILDRCASRGT